jgi:NCAIR mutase (PurE)-related protein
LDKTDIRQLLSQVAEGGLSVEEAMLRLKMEPFEDLGFAKLDHHRSLRQGAGEVIYGAGKTPEQIREIADALLRRGQRTVLITRLQPRREVFIPPASVLRIRARRRARRHAGAGRLRPDRRGDGRYKIYRCREAALTAEVFGNREVRCTTWVVAGLHRLLSHVEEIMSARVIVAIAGWRGRSPAHRRPGRLSGHRRAHQRRLRAPTSSVA